MRRKIALSGAIALVAGVLALATPVAHASTTVVVKPSSPNGWAFLVESGTGTGSFVAGPDTAPTGSGSARLEIAGGTDGLMLGAAAYAGTRFDAITGLAYSTYRASVDAGNNLAAALQLNVDYDLTDATVGWQGRLVFEPYQAAPGAVDQGSWQSWDALAGKWWATGAPGNALCPQASPCTWSDVLTNWPDAGVHATLGAVLFKAGSGWAAGFDGNVDAFTIGVGGTDTTYDFEPETACTTTCYVDAVSGNDAFGGDTDSSAKETIQAALNQVSAGGQVRVLPGTYSESAPGSTPTSVAGTYQFGLFFHSSKPGITLMGVTAADVPITDASSTEAIVNTNATNSFGYSGIFVEAANTTIQGLEIGPNAAGDNKTIEVVADNFTLAASDTSVPGGGSVYINDFDPDGDVVQSYHVVDNLFDDATSIDISSGAGWYGPVAGREIIGNTFDLLGNSWNAISFNGSGTGVPWFVNPVGGAVIQSNDFSGGSEQYIRARGTYDNTQFDWSSYWTDNTFDKAAVALVSESPFDVRTFAYASGSYTFNEVRRIGTTIQLEIDHTVSGDTVLVADGIYEESPRILHSLTLTSVNGGDSTTIALKTGPSYLGALEIGGPGSDVTVDGFTIQGRDAACPTLATSNVLIDPGPDAVALTDNRFEVGEAGNCSTGDDGFGFLTTYSTSVNLNSLTVEDNLFVPLNTSGTRAFYVNPGTGEFTFRGNEVTGKFTGTAITQAATGLVEDNVVDGEGLGGRGLGTWGYPDATAWGHTTFQGNILTGLLAGININESNDVVIQGNEITDNGFGVQVLEPGAATGFDPTTIEIHQNNITGNATAGVNQTATTAGTVDATCNWWGAMNGPTAASNPPGTGDAAIGDLDVHPWLIAAAPDGACGPYVFEGFFSPINNPPTMNLAKAGRAMPVKWRIVEESGTPVDDPASFVSLTSYETDCDSLIDRSDDQIENYVPGSGLAYKGDGNWQFNWDTRASYAGSCRVMVLTLADGTTHTANFEFR